jgi:hypothetical protein
MMMAMESMLQYPSISASGLKDKLKLVDEAWKDFERKK